MVLAPINHITLDDRGVPYIIDTRMKVEDIAINSSYWGMTPEEIHDNYPTLTLSQIHAALSYYHDHKDEIDARIAESVREVERMRAENPNPLTRAELVSRDTRA